MTSRLELKVYISKESLMMKGFIFSPRLVPRIIVIDIV